KVSPSFSWFCSMGCRHDYPSCCRCWLGYRDRPWSDHRCDDLAPGLDPLAGLGAYWLTQILRLLLRQSAPHPLSLYSPLAIKLVTFRLPPTRQGQHPLAKAAMAPTNKSLAQINKSLLALSKKCTL